MMNHRILYTALSAGFETQQQQEINKKNGIMRLC